MSYLVAYMSALTVVTLTALVFIESRRRGDPQAFTLAVLTGLLLPVGVVVWAVRRSRPQARQHS